MKNDILLIGLVALGFLGLNTKPANTQANPCSQVAAHLNQIAQCNPGDICVELNNAELTPQPEGHCYLEVNADRPAGFIAGPNPTLILTINGEEEVVPGFTASITTNSIEINFNDTEKKLEDVEELQLRLGQQGAYVYHTIEFTNSVVVNEAPAASQQPSQQDKDKAKALKNAAIKQKLDAIKKMKKYKWK